MHNLILITVDCLRADHLGCYGYPRPTSPSIDRLGGESWLFERPVVAGTPTYYSFPAIMASRYPLSLGRNAVGLAPGEATLASRLREAGYDTAAWIAGNPYLSRRDRYHEGFDRVEDFLAASRREPLAGEVRRSLGRSKEVLKTLLRRALGSGRTGTYLYQEVLFRHWYLRGRRRVREMAESRQYPAADAVVEPALSWLERHAAEPFFLWLHLMDPHHPYYPPEEALDLLGRSDLDVDRAHWLNALWSREEVPRRRLERHRRDVVALYDAGIRWVDRQVGELVSRLRSTGLWDRTLFALTGDHGEEFLEHGGRYHYPLRLSSELVRVPLLIHSPGGGPDRVRWGRGRVPGIFSLIDLAPTLLAMLGIDSPPSFMGASRWRGDGFEPGTHAVTECVYDRRQPWAERDRDGARLAAVESGGYRLVVNFATGVEELYDLADDPGETSPLAPGAAPAVRRELLLRLRAHLRRSRPDYRSRSYLRAQLAAIERSLL